jgi:hypothetical protein
MRSAYTRGFMFATALLLLFVLGSCGVQEAVEPVTALTEEQVTGIAENMLQAYNSGDYSAFERDLAPAGQLLLTEQAFNELRDELLASAGEFVSIESVEAVPGGSEGHSQWQVTASFQNTTQSLTLTFDDETNRVEGLEFE